MVLFRGANLCKCDIAANFPIVGNYGIISASLRTNANVVRIAEGLVAVGPTTGDLSINAYAPFGIDEMINDPVRGLRPKLVCPGNAGVSFEWDQRVDCDSEFGTIIMRFIPRGRAKAFQEGEVTNKITMSYVNPNDPYLTFNASASSGPTTPYFMNYHYDGYNFRYTGNPIAITSDSGEEPTTVSFLSNILPNGSTLYLTNFSWTHTPPEIPTVSYSFLFSYTGAL